MMKLKHFLFLICGFCFLKPLYSETVVTVSASQIENAGTNIVTLSFPITARDADWRKVDGRWTWKIKVLLPEHYSIVPLFDKLSLPTTGEIQAASLDQKRSTRVFNKNENSKTTAFALPLIKSNKAVITVSVVGQEFENLVLSLNKIGCILDNEYKSTEEDDFLGFNTVDPCFANINCEEGKAWQQQKRAVVKYMTISHNSIGFCTGVLVNNTKEDDTPYCLSAQHCGKRSTIDELGQFVFYFNYEAVGGTTPTNDIGLEQQTVVGCQQVASSGRTTSPVPDGSDFMLMRLTAIPTSYHPYFAGWNRRPVEQLEGAGAIIQHPRADLKKISFWKKAQQGFTSNAHGDFEIIASEHGSGTVEPMSSGSPIFDKKKLVVANVTAGSSGCMKEGEYDSVVGGLFQKHWDQNGAEIDLQLKPWLDPLNSGVLELAGKELTQTIIPKETEKIGVEINRRQLEIKTDVVAIEVQLFDILGTLVLTSKRHTITLDQLSKGLYIVKIKTQKTIVVRKILLT